MNPRFTWSLLAITAALFLLIVFVERPYRLARNELPDTRLFPNLRISALTGIQIHPAGQLEIRAERTNASWELVRPISYPADPAKIDLFLRIVSSLRSQAHITSAELRGRSKVQEQFGFDVPQYSVVLQDGDSVRHLLVGKEVIGDQIYVEIVGGDGIYITDAELLAALPHTSAEWRDPAAVPQSVADADAIEVRSAGKNFLRLDLNTTNGLWRMAKPLDARANGAKVHGLVTNLLNLRVAGFVSDDANADFEKFGLPNTPAQPAELELSFFHGTNVLGGLQAGSVSSNNTGLHARRMNLPTVFLLPKESLDTWRVPPNDFRDRRLIALPPAGITNVEVGGPQPFTLTRPPNGAWRVADARTADAEFILDQDAVNEFLLILSRIEVNFENDVVVDFQPFGLASPTNATFQCKLSGTLTNASAVNAPSMEEALLFGLAATNRIFVRRGGEERVYSVNLQEFDLLPRTLWQFRNRQIWNFDSTNVVKVTIEQSGRTRTILHDGPDEWSLGPGSQGAVNPGLLEEAMHRLGQMKAIAWTADGEADRTKFGFEQASHKLTVTLKNGGATHNAEIEFGGFSPYYQPYGAVQINGRRMVFEFPVQLYLDFIRRDLSILPRPLPGT